MPLAIIIAASYSPASADDSSTATSADSYSLLTWDWLMPDTCRGTGAALVLLPGMAVLLAKESSLLLPAGGCSWAFLQEEASCTRMRARTGRLGVPDLLLVLLVPLSMASCILPAGWPVLRSTHVPGGGTWAVRVPSRVRLILRMHQKMMGQVQVQQQVSRQVGNEGICSAAMQSWRDGTCP